ncbi:hypothetical protein [Parvibaculum sp.]|uniref:hypothetical protein n=1 Tax=Parvibaculum sp. TaxID=2024848 RepID=UPI001B0097D2|nr:hypothetical protein [Parvibaculum sp.]MBO6666826.1 hypothetical protein [Parvibaculum sp.]MBO6691656.1 hypothetical protein [Parvibaculum sp.]MBO6713447.1 hypothetical protein [Parvibaculum sp.]
MRWFRLQVPVLYAASILLAAALQCVPASALQMHGLHAEAKHQHEGHAEEGKGHSAASEGNGSHSHPCSGGDLTCLCGRADGVSLSAQLTSRDLSEVKALLEDRWQTPDADFALQPLPSAKPPERPVLERRAYAEAYRRTNRLLI